MHSHNYHGLCGGELLWDSSGIDCMIPEKIVIPYSKRDGLFIMPLRSDRLADPKCWQCVIDCVEKAYNHVPSEGSKDA